MLSFAADLHWARTGRVPRSRLPPDTPPRADLELRVGRGRGEAGWRGREQGPLWPVCLPGSLHACLGVWRHAARRKGALPPLLPPPPPRAPPGPHRAAAAGRRLLPAQLPRARAVPAALHSRPDHIIQRLRQPARRAERGGPRAARRGGVPAARAALLGHARGGDPHAVVLLSHTLPPVGGPHGGGGAAAVAPRHGARAVVGHDPGVAQVPRDLALLHVRARPAGAAEGGA
jgi:hypothetical protein